ncbi:hypothetical protein [Arthrobacter alpinus]|uniref:hypothetical protein n=1 Tax=Arthrobacter alpinus TaxID=656366 RepID=UPI002354EAED|nr:hypothetical protein [Arthrobacter alpinus]
MNSRYALLSDAQWELFARLPAMKTLTGFDYSSVRFVEDYGRESLESLDFINRAKTSSFTVMLERARPTWHPPWWLPSAARASRPGSSRPLPW